VHELWPSLLLTKPSVASQAMHTSLPPAEDVPAAHSSHLLVLGSALLPGPQKVHELRPSLLLTKPELATQGTQVAAAAPDTSPTGQVVHAPALGPLKVPDSQSVHASAPSGANVPPSHSWQVDAPSPAYVPASQFDAHSDDPAELRRARVGVRGVGITA
jgi:hypothetical protein